MEFLRTPDERFAKLPNYPFEPNYLEVGDGMRMHYVDEGPKDAPETVLLLHGEPSWSFLYRKMIPVYVNAGYRVIAPDLIGFGKSDKPTQRTDYTYTNFLDWTRPIIQSLDLQNINLFCQDWGGLLGLRFAVEMPDRFLRVVAANTGLPTGEHQATEGFKKWLQFSQNVPQFPVGQILSNATATDLSPEVIAAYDAPFPDESYKAGARIFPALVPISPDMPEAANNKAAWEKWMQWKKPFLTLFSDKDPVTKGGEKVWQKLVPGAKGQPHEIIENGGHFLQEDQGELIAEKMVAFMEG